MTYKTTLEFLFSQLPMYQRIGPSAYKADLENTIELCNLLDNPQNSFRTIHVAGTNGKGSVSHMLASILVESGLRVGLYTSPHLKDFRERIRVNGKMIPKRKVIDFVKRNRPAFENIQPSFFEMTVALAFDHFRDEKIDIGVIEVGLGGKLDSTNVITPVLSVITNISLDHTQFLGNTPEQIAREKAGIIKKGVPVVIGESCMETKDVFLSKAHELNSPISFADEHFICDEDPLSAKTQEMLRLKVIHDDVPLSKDIHSPLTGIYQKKNIVTVLECCEHLQRNGFGLTTTNIAKGIRNVIRNTWFQGRWQVLSENPMTICDTCHNPGGLTEALAQIRKMNPHKVHFVFGVVNDKDLHSMLPMLPKNAVYYFCKADIPRGMDATELKNLASAEGLKGNAYSSVHEAFQTAKNAAGKKDLVFVGGSIFVVAEVV
jgi:dihydrofolate synthase / folylpolyglutamate synthase